MGKEKKKMGRPSMNPKERRCCKVDMRLTKAEKLTLEKAAQAAGTNISQYLLLKIKS